MNQEQNSPSRRQRHTTQQFTKGINHRIDKYEAGPDQLHRLENARIYARGSTLSVSRFEGFIFQSLFGSDGEMVLVDGEYQFQSFVDKVYDMMFGLNDHFFVYFAFTTGVSKVRIYDTDDIENMTLIEEFDVGINTDVGELVRKDGSIYLTPHNLMINYYDAEYYLNPTTATQPKIISINNPVGEVIEFPP